MLSENFRQNCFTLQGKALQKWADTLFLQEHVQAERDFVSEVREYASSSGEKALLVTGLRSTGKTVGILQGLPLEETLYLCPSSKNSIQAEEVLSFLKEIASSEEKPRILAVDEYGWIEDPAGALSNYLAGLTKTGTRVVITGTESALVHGLLYTDFIHRAREIHTTFFSFSEFCRIYALQGTPKDMTRYLSEGGVLNCSAYNAAAISRYIQSSILDNITSFFPNQDPEQVKLCVYTCFYECVCGSFEVNGIKTAPVFSYKRGASYEEFLENFGVRTDLAISRMTFDLVTGLLVDLGILVKVEDLRRSGQYRVYVTNQAITSQMILAIYGEQIVETSHIGYLFEASVVCNTFFHKNPVCEIRFLLGRSQGIEYEIDFILIENQEAYLFECKHSANPDFEINPKASLLKDTVDNLLGAKDIDVYGRYVIYQGPQKYREVNGKPILYLSDWTVAACNYRDFDRLAAEIQLDGERSDFP